MCGRSCFGVVRMEYLLIQRDGRGLTNWLIEEAKITYSVFYVNIFVGSANQKARGEASTNQVGRLGNTPSE